MTEHSLGQSARTGDTDRKQTRIQAKNENKILNAAQEVIAEYGFHGTTIDRIADLAGMSKPNLHYYFRTKEALYVAVLHRTLNEWLAPFSNLDPDGDPADEIRAYIEAKVEMARKHPTASRVFANEIIRGAPVVEPFLKTELREMVSEKASVIRHWIEAKKMADIDPVHLIFLIWAATQHYADFLPQVKAVTDQRVLAKEDYADVSKSLCEIILHGILPRED